MKVLTFSRYITNHSRYQIDGINVDPCEFLLLRYSKVDTYSKINAHYIEEIQQFFRDLELNLVEAFSRNNSKLIAIDRKSNHEVSYFFE